MLKLAWNPVAPGNEFALSGLQRNNTRHSNFTALVLTLALPLLMLCYGLAIGFDDLWLFFSMLVGFVVVIACPFVFLLNKQLLNKLNELAKSEVNLRNAQRIAKMGSWECDLGFRNLFASEETFKILEIEGRSDTPLHLDHVFDKRTLKIILGHLQRAVKGNVEADVSVRFVTRRGNVKWLRILAYVVHPGHSRLNGIVHDITAIKEAQHSIDDKERKFKKVYERLSHHLHHSPLPIIERDKDLKVTFWNKRAEELFGWSAEEVLGKDHHSVLVHPADHADVSETLQNAISGNQESSQVERKCITKDGRVLDSIWYHSFLRDEQGQVETILSVGSDITEQRAVHFSLGERIKELRTLHNVSQLLSASDKTMEDVFKTLPALLPPGWQFPEICAAKLVVFSAVYQTDNFKETPFVQSMDINVKATNVGSLNILYVEQGPWPAGEPFLKEENDLLTTLVSMLKEYILRKLEEDELTKSQANLFATINNTDTMIWSVDQHLRLLTFNESFSRYNLKQRNMSVTRGIEHHYFFDPDASEIWTERYKRALGGETVKVEEKVDGHDFMYSLNPIVEKGNITGVSVFADDITDHNFRSNQLAEANRKIIDLKMMALRSVMNPHFIFNVLSSIQFFITRNDELNAINYLTSFSKLMRTVLTRSVADLVTVREEINLVHNYVDLEKLRFEDKFYFDLECEQPDQLENLKMPSLLLQPYVENAILHGLYNKEGKGTLILRIKQAGGFVIFEIEDDGIGREAARKITEKRPAQRKSMGTQLTEERLALLNGAGFNSVTYTDLYNGKKPAGTRVTIQIKITQSDEAKLHNN